MEISRSFSKKVQIEQYSPIEAFCSLKAEVEEKNIEKVSEKLFDICVREVNKDIARQLNVKEEEEEKQEEIIEMEVPRCSLCGERMAKTKQGSRKSWYCKHSKDGKIVWGEPVFTERKLDEKEEEFIKSLK